jgi:orotate phosphoribosyltransferase
MTTGNSVREVIAAVKKLGGTVVGVGVLVDRTVKSPDFSVPFYACHRAEVITYQPGRCPLCAKKIPLVKPGSSKSKA